MIYLLIAVLITALLLYCFFTMPRYYYIQFRFLVNSHHLICNGQTKIRASRRGFKRELFLTFKNLVKSKTNLVVDDTDLEVKTISITSISSSDYYSTMYVSPLCDNFFVKQERIEPK